MLYSNWFLNMEGICLFGGLGLLAIGSFVANQTFLKMRFFVERPKGWRGIVSGFWISRDRAKRVEAQYLADGGSSRVLSVNRIAHLTSITGAVGLAIGIVGMCFMIRR